MSEPLHPEVAILNMALELPVEERAAYLDGACAGNAALRQQVEALLKANDQAEDFLDRLPTALEYQRAESASISSLERPGARIGRYRLLELIGQGGCGGVYLAEQEEPVRRRVALKVIKLGMDTKQVIARFEVERQALAMMDHPNIAKVLDAGATETGRPYFVMELVRGLKITEFCRQNKVPIRDRLKLLIQVCQAIQHAHQKGVIHRDIKPSNILVTVNDGPAAAGVPKVIDFGIAKAIPQLRERLTDQTFLTACEQFIGTPAYMSPEQTAVTGLDIDTRSDIYSLGVLLYELLTGRTPFDQKELLAAGLDEMRRMIREVDPLQPSARLTKDLAAAPRASAAKEKAPVPHAHGVAHPPSPPATLDFQQIKELIPILRGDLDWIVMKCLEKDRARRYETANGLALDLQRYLSHEPVMARPPTPLYRFQKLVRRNKLTFAAVAVLAVALVMVSVGSSIAAWRVGGARRAEQSERQKAETANQQLRETVSLLELDRAEELFRAHDMAAGAAHLAALLRRDPSNQIAADRLVSALLHRNWVLPLAAPVRHSGSIEAACFSPDGQHVLSVGQDQTVRIRDATTATLVANLPHPDRIFSARYNPDGDRVVTASADGTARIWSATNGAALTPPLLHGDKVYWAEFSNDGRNVVTASADGLARIWDAMTGELKRELRGHTSPVVLARFHPNGKRVVTGGAHGSIRMWEASSGAMVFRLEYPLTNLVALAFSPDGRWLVSACVDGRARLWNATNGQPVPKVLTHKEAIEHAAFSPDSQLVLTTSQDDTARVWEAETGYPVAGPFLHQGRVLFGAFSPEGRSVVTTSMDNSARLWDVRTGMSLAQPLRQYERIIQANFSPDGRRLVTASYDSTVQVWDIRPRRFSGIEMHSDATLFSVAFSPDGRSVLTSSGDKTARLWDARSGQPVGGLLLHDYPVLHAEFSPEGQRVVTACVDGTARVWDLTTSRVVAGPFRHTQKIWPARFSPDGERVLTASSDGTARVWNARTSQPLTPPLTHRDSVNMAGFSPDGRFIVTASKDCSARVWNAVTGEPATQPLWHLDHVTWAEFSPDGNTLVTASADNTARIWDARAGRQLTPPLPHPRTVEHVVLSPDGRRVATASLDRTARIWDVRTGEAMTPPLLHDSPLTRVCFSPNGRRILTSCRNGNVRLWDVNTGRPLTEWLDAGGWVWGVCFDSTGEQVATAANGARVWRMPPAPMPVPAWFAAFVEALAGMRLGVRGNVELVSRSELDKFAQQLEAGKSKEFYLGLAQWFLADPENRSATPF